MSKSFLNMPGYPRGLRNNNPGNLKTGEDWKGMTGSNDGFVVFDNIAWGLRAMAMVLGNDIKAGNNTIRGLIYEYAPPSDNNPTESYIDTVVQYSGFKADQPLPPTWDALRKVMRGMLIEELGAQYAALVTDQDINEAFALVSSPLLSFFQQAIEHPGISAGVVVGGLSVIGLLVYLLTRPKKKTHLQ